MKATKKNLKRIIDNSNFLKNLIGADSRDFAKYISQASNDEINAISEILYNILIGGAQCDNVDIFRPYKVTIRALANPKNKLPQRRNLT